MEKKYDELLCCIENAISEHISALKEINKSHKPETLEGFWDYQTVSDSNEALLELRRLLTPNKQA